MTDTTVYAVASGKGGVGKTTTAVNLGTALAEAGHTVAVVDTDLGMGNLAGAVGLGDATNLNDVLSGRAQLEEATHELADRLVVVPGGADLMGYATSDATKLTAVVEALDDRFEYVILDVGAGISHEAVLPLGVADAVLLIATPEPASVQDARKTMELVEHVGGDPLGLVMNRTRPADGVSHGDIAARLDLPLLATIPEDESVRESILAGMPLVVHEPDAPASRAFRQFALLLSEESTDRAPAGEDAVADADPRPGATAAEDAEEEPAASDADESTAATEGETADAGTDADEATTEEAEADAAEAVDASDGESAATEADRPAADAGKAVDGAEADADEGAAEEPGEAERGGDGATAETGDGRATGETDEAETSTDEPAADEAPADADEAAETPDTSETADRAETPEEPDETETVVATVSEAEPDAASAQDEGATTDSGEEPDSGAVPFRDAEADEEGTDETAEETEEDAGEGEEDAGEGEEDAGEGEEDAGEGDEDDDEESSGFLSRLFG